MGNIVAFTGAVIDKAPPSLVPRPPVALARSWGAAARVCWRRARLIIEAVGWLVFGAATWAVFVD